MRCFRGVLLNILGAALSPTKPYFGKFHEKWTHFFLSKMNKNWFRSIFEGFLKVYRQCMCLLELFLALEVPGETSTLQGHHFVTFQERSARDNFAVFFKKIIKAKIHEISFKS